MCVTCNCIKNRLDLNGQACFKRKKSKSLIPNVTKLTMKMDVKRLIKVCLDAVDAHKRVPTTI